MSYLSVFPVRSWVPYSQTFYLCFFSTYNRFLEYNLKINEYLKRVSFEKLFPRKVSEKEPLCNQRLLDVLENKGPPLCSAFFNVEQHFQKKKFYIPEEMSWHLHSAVNAQAQKIMLIWWWLCYHFQELIYRRKMQIRSLNGIKKRCLFIITDLNSIFSSWMIIYTLF